MFDHRTAFADRRIDLEALPHNLAIETVLGCNIRCRMCPVTYARETMTQRELGIIDVTLVEEVLRQISDRPRNVLFSCLGEPLIHPELPRLVRMAKEQGHRTSLITNAVLLDKAMAKALIDAGIDGVQVSMDRYHREACESLPPGISYETVVDNALRFADLAGKADRAITVDINHIVSPDSPDGPADVFEVLGKHVNTIRYNQLTNFWGHFDLPPDCARGDAVDSDLLFKKHPCIFLWESLCISVEGYAMLCANDFNRQSALPNVTDKPITEIWTGEVREERKRQLEGVFTGPCRSCTRWEVRYRAPVDHRFHGFRRFPGSRLLNWFVRPHGFMDHPVQDQAIRGPLDVMGWALADAGKRVKRVDVILDACVSKQADYGLMRPDVTAAYPDRDGRWFAGFLCRFDSAAFSPGTHTVEAIVTDDAGRKASIGRVDFRIVH